MQAVDDPMQLELLLDLQKVETERRRQRRALEELEAQRRLDEAIAEHDRLGKARDELVLARTDVDARVTRAEREVAQLRVRLDKERERLYGGGVTNAREEKSVQAEIKAVQDRIDASETEALELLEQADELAERIAATDAELEEQAASVAHLTMRRDEAAGALVAAIAELDVDVEQRRTDLDDDLLATYEQVAAKRPGRAVGRLDGDRCTACQIALPKAEAQDLRAGPLLGSCPNCGALVVTREAKPS